MRLLHTRAGKPRLKPGFTWTRLLLFLVACVAFAIVGEHFVAGSEPSGDCGSKEIDRGARLEGTCTEDGTTIVVVDRDGVLRLKTVAAKLLGIQKRKTVTGPAGSKTTSGRFVTFDLRVTNLTGSPQKVAAGQFMLEPGDPDNEAFEVDRDLEPRSFLARDRTIPPQGSEVGTVTFGMSVKGATALSKSGNLDMVNLGRSVSPYEPEGLFTEPEYGAIRTYK